MVAALARRMIPWLLALAVAVLVILLAVRLQPLVSLASLEAHRHAVAGYGVTHPMETAIIFALVYIAFAALPLPGAEVLTIAAGAIFGLVEGTVLVSFSSSIGATLAFLASRWWLADLVQKRFVTRARAFSLGIESEGAFYLFALRLVPIVPFFLVNLVMGLTGLRPLTFYWVSQVGMLPATIAYVNAGLQLALLRSASGILSPRVLLSFAALGVLPLAARYAVKAVQDRTR